jgi:hypothetical protein
MAVISRSKRMLAGASAKVMRSHSAAKLPQDTKNGYEVSVQDDLDIYGDFVCALAKSLTPSPEEAEAATLEIFADIWRHRRDGDLNKVNERAVIEQITRRRLFKLVEQSAQMPSK